MNNYEKVNLFVLANAAPLNCHSNRLTPNSNAIMKTLRTLTSAALLAGLSLLPFFANLTQAQVVSGAAPIPARAILPPPTPVFDVRTYGAKGDGSTYDTAAIQAAINACAGTGGSVLLSKGCFVTAALELKGKMTFYVAKDAILLGGLEPEDYPELLPYMLNPKLIPFMILRL